MNYDFVAIGDIVCDTFIELTQAKISEGESGKILSMKFADKIPFNKATYVAGVGNSANAAVAAARLTLSTTFFGIIGDDINGNNCKESLQNESITSYITYSDLPTNHHYVLSFQAERTILVHHNKYHYLELIDSLPGITAKTIYLSSLSEDATIIYPKLLSYLKHNPETLLVFQPGTYQLKNAHTPEIKPLYQHCSILILNKEEAELITQLPHSTDIKKLLAVLCTYGPPTVIITDGPAGAYMSHGGMINFCPMYPDIAPPVERTGAGDAFASTFASYLTLGFSHHDAFIRAPINSMNVVQHIGAQKGLLPKNILEDYLTQAPNSYKITEI